MDLALFTHPDTLVSLLTLTAMEIVLGIDNIVFISILTGRLPAAQQAPARRLGLGLALVMRLGLLFAISWVMSLTTPLFHVLGRGFSGRHLILLGGGLFLIAKATHEIHSKLEGSGEEAPRNASARAFGLILLQIMVLDLVFSLDSVITAVGMVDEIAVMVVAMIIAVGVMLTFAGAVGNFVHRHPTMKILALSFLLLIGVMLVAESLGQHIAKGTIYFAMAFSLVVELLNLRLRKRSQPVTLHEPVDPTARDHEPRLP
jgi:predicted tellurium resistance membrane protein TerC